MTRRRTLSGLASTPRKRRPSFWDTLWMKKLDLGTKSRRERKKSNRRRLIEGTGLPRSRKSNVWLSNRKNWSPNQRILTLTNRLSINLNWRKQRCSQHKLRLSPSVSLMRLWSKRLEIEPPIKSWLMINLTIYSARWSKRLRPSRLEKWKSSKQTLVINTKVNLSEVLKTMMMKVSVKEVSMTRRCSVLSTKLVISTNNNQVWAPLVASRLTRQDPSSKVTC